MAYVEPNSTVVFIKAPLDPNYENTLRFPPASELGRDAQEWYFLYSDLVQRYTIYDQSYQRKTRNSIKVEGGIGTYRQYNYMAFKNTDFENKWFYAFITDVEYINNITCEVFYRLDVIQTYFFDVQFNQCMIERQHNETDALGDNIIDEGLETGEYIVNTSSRKNFTPVIVVAVTEEWDSTNNKFVPVDGYAYTGINDSWYYSGTKYVIFNPSTLACYDQTITLDLNDFIQLYTEKNKINAILSIFIGASEIFVATTQGWTTMLIVYKATLPKIIN